MKRFVCLAVAAMFFTAVPAAAQSIYFGVGPTFPMGDFGDAANTGLMIAGGATFEVAPQLSIYGEGFWGQNGGESDIVDIDYNPSGLMGGLLYGFSAEDTAPVAPYVFGGAGLLTLSNGDAESGFGFQGGVGLGFDLAGLEAFTEGRFTSGSINDVTISFAALMVGLSFDFGT